MCAMRNHLSRFYRFSSPPLTHPALPPYFNAHAQRLLEPEDEFMILACDGLWDVLTSQEAVDIVNAFKHLGAEEAVRELAHTAYDAGSYDNISVVLVLFTKPPPGPVKGEIASVMPAPVSNKLARQTTFLPGSKPKA